MKTRQFVRLTSLVLCLTPALLLGAPSESDVHPVSSDPFRIYHSYSPTSAEVFDAFHSSGPSNQTVTPTVPSPLIDASSAAVYPNEFRTIDGRKNTSGNLGAAGPHLRNTTVDYADGSGSPAGPNRKGARETSNLVLAQTSLFPNSANVSGFFWNWGNIIDHDMTLTRVSSPQEPFPIPVPRGDPTFDPRGRGTATIFFNRSNFQMLNGIRQQLNANTAFLDASIVYGSDTARSLDLRTQDGTGHLRTGDGNLLPLNTNRLSNQPTNDPSFFIAGDTRSNENLALCSMQTLLMREHNYWADQIKAGDPTLNDDGIYQRARAIVGAELQMITYRDFIPLLLGPDALPTYTGYNPAVDPRVSLAFNTAAMRIGHTLLPPVLERLNNRNNSIGDLPLGSTLFQPQLITAGGVEPFLRGLAHQVPQEVDGYIIDALRNFGSGNSSTGFDLAALNIQRGRDHGLPSYNQVRIDFGLTPKASFEEMTSNLDFQARLASAYSSPDDVDVWVGALVEDHVNGGQVGETFAAIFKDQFQRTRDGDRFWYESYLDPATLATVQAETLSTIIKRNTLITDIQSDAFHVVVTSGPAK